MKRNLNELQSELPKLISLIKKWKLNQPTLALAIGMAPSTFKLKLNETNKKYSFTTQEFLDVCSVIDKMMAEFKNFLEEIDQNDDDLL